MIVFLTLLAVANAAPQFRYHDHLRFSSPDSSNKELSPFSGDVFDTDRFWAELAAEIHRMNEMMNEFSRRFPTSSSSEGIKDDEYQITIDLSGFDEKDIVVKAREGVLMIQAVHKINDNDERSYLDLRTLPSYVNVNGTWTYENETLRITFPLKEKPKGTEEETEKAVSNEVNTEAYVETKRDREEMETNHLNENEDADVGLRENQDNEKEQDLLSNTIYRHSPVEATTYAVDLKNEVEFVPIKIYK